MNGFRKSRADASSNPSAEGQQPTEQMQAYREFYKAERERVAKAHPDWSGADVKERVNENWKVCFFPLHRQHTIKTLIRRHEQKSKENPKNQK